MTHSPGYAFVSRVTIFACCCLFFSACAFQQTVVTTIDTRSAPASAPSPAILTVWHTVTPAQAAALQAIADEWARNQTVPVEVALRSMSGAESLHQALLAGIQTQQPPDLAFVRAADLHVYAEADALLRLDEYWATLSGAQQADFLPGARAATRCEVDGESALWAMPVHRNEMVMFINRSQLVGRLGLEKAPVTWEELLAVCSSHVEASPYVCLSAFPTGELASLLLMSHGNPVVDPRTHETALDDASSLSLLHHLVALRDGGAIQVALSPDSARLDFTAGRTLFTIDRTNRIEGYSEAIGNDFEWEIAPLPGDGVDPRALATGGDIALFHSTPEREALGLSLLGALTQPSTNGRWAEAMDALPVRQTALDALSRDAAPHLRSAAALLPAAYHAPCTPSWRSIETELERLVSDTLNGVAAPETILAGAVRATDSLLR